MSEYLTLPECEKLTGIHIDTLRRNARNGGLIANRISDGFAAWRVKKTDLDAFVNKRKNGPSFDIFPGGLSRRKTGKDAPPVTHDQVHMAMQEYLEKGGEIKRLNYSSEPPETNFAHKEPTILDEIEEQ
jgi:hypothetical protein